MKRIVILCFAFCLLLAGCNCEHSFAAGEEGCVCSECGEVEPHTYSADGRYCVCSVCGYIEDHDYNRAYSVYTCGQCGYSIDVVKDVLPEIGDQIGITDRSEFAISFDENEGVIVFDIITDFSVDLLEKAMRIGEADNLYTLGALLYQMLEKEVDWSAFENEFGLSLDYVVRNVGEQDAELLRVDERGCVYNGEVVKSWDDLN